MNGRRLRKLKELQAQLIARGYRVRWKDVKRAWKERARNGDYDYLVRRATR